MIERRTSQILLIEDNVLDADLIRHALAKVDAGIGLSVARDGEEALAIFKRWDDELPTPIVILLDLQLPKINGIEILKTLKTHPRYRVLPVVVLTSSNTRDDIQTAYALGANSYILKPINYDLLARTVTLVQRYWCKLNIQPE